MGSVTVHWQGMCNDRPRQEQLVAHLEVLAQRSAARLERPAPPRPAMLELMAAQREAPPEVDAIRLFDGQIEGRIVVDPYLTSEGQALYDQVIETGTEMIDVLPGGAEKATPFCLSLNPSSGQKYLVVDSLRVHGLDFRLYDPRDLYPQENRVSFVFLESDRLPALNGCVAQLENSQQSAAYGSPEIRLATWFVSGPSIHLRYYLEDWCDLLLSWVKHFFMPDLQFHRYEPLSGYESFCRWLNERRGAEGRETPDEELRLRSFAAIVDLFEREADDWISKMASWASTS